MTEITATLTDTDDSTTDAAEYTFTGMSIGAAGADRTVLVHGASRGTGGCTGVTVTVAGITATIDAFTGWSGTGNGVFVARAAVPTGTTADVVVTWSATVLRCAVALLVTPDAIQPHDSVSVAGEATALTLTATIATAPDGLVTGVAVSPNNSGSFSWTGLDEDANWALAEFLTTSVAHARTVDDAGLTVSATSTVAPMALTVVSYARAGYVPVPAWTRLPWREMIESDGWRALVEAKRRRVGFRAEMIDTSGITVADLPIAAAGVSFDGDVAEQWAASLTVVGSEWVPRSPSDPLDPRSGLRCRLWWRIRLDASTWVEIPCGVYCLDDPRISDDGTGPVITITGRDPLTVLRRAGYGSQVVAVGGLTVPDAIRHVITSLSLADTIRVDSSSSVTLPAVFELSGRDPLDDLTEIAAQAGLIIRTDREGAIIAAPAPEPQRVRADWQEGDDCPVITLDVEIGTSEMVNSVTVVSTSPEVDPPVVATVEDDDPTSPTYVGGPWGRRGLTIRTDAVATVEGAQGLARSTLEGRRRPTEAVEVEVPARPDLGFRDLISLARAASGVGGLYRVAGWTLRVGSAVDAPPTMTVRMMTRTAL